MFILDSLMIAGIRWTLETVVTAAEAEMNDDSALRERLLEAEMQRELGDIDDETFRQVEADLLARIRDIKERRDGGAGPLAFGSAPLDTRDGTIDIEASVAGDFHEPATAADGAPAPRPAPAPRVAPSRRARTLPSRRASRRRT